MKNSTCIFLIAVFLCSCKGTSFLKQRYTNYGHAVAKNTTGIKKATFSAPSTSSQTKVALVYGDAQINNLVSAEEKQVDNTKNSFTTLSEKSTDVLQNSTSLDGNDEEVSQPASLSRLSNSSELGSSKNKTISKKTNHTSYALTKAIIGTVFKIVLFAIILAVVVAIIILVSIL